MLPDDSKQKFKQSLAGAGLTRYYQSKDLIDPSLPKTLKLNEANIRLSSKWVNRVAGFEKIKPADDDVSVAAQRKRNL
jgi:hypothetical protein